MMGETANSGASQRGDDFPHSDEEDLEIETALLSLLAARDVGEATEPIDLAALSPTEKQVLLQMMRTRIGFVEPTQRPVTEMGEPFAG